MYHKDSKATNLTMLLSHEFYVDMNVYYQHKQGHFADPNNQTQMDNRSPSVSGSGKWSSFSLVPMQMLTVCTEKCDHSFLFSEVYNLRSLLYRDPLLRLAEPASPSAVYNAPSIWMYRRIYQVSGLLLVCLYKSAWFTKSSFFCKYNCVSVLYFLISSVKPKPVPCKTQKFCTILGVWLICNRHFQEIRKARDQCISITICKLWLETYIYVNVCIAFAY